MRGKRLQRVRGFGIVVGEQEVAYSVVQRVVQAALALEGVSFTECTIFQKQLYDLVVSAETGLENRGYHGALRTAASRAPSTNATSVIVGWLTRINGV